MKDFSDPTFTPLRDDQQKFKQYTAPPIQVKKNPNDPDFTDIDEGVIALCQRNGMARGCLNLYLEGRNDWRTTLEVMVVLLGRELLVNQIILSECRNEYVEVSNQLEKKSEVLMLGEEEKEHDQLMDSLAK